MAGWKVQTASLLSGPVGLALVLAISSSVAMLAVLAAPLAVPDQALEPLPSLTAFGALLIGTVIAVIAALALEPRLSGNRLWVRLSIATLLIAAVAGRNGTRRLNLDVETEPYVIVLAALIGATLALAALLRLARIGGRARVWPLATGTLIAAMVGLSASARIAGWAMWPEITGSAGFAPAATLMAITPVVALAVLTIAGHGPRGQRGLPPSRPPGRPPRR